MDEPRMPDPRNEDDFDTWEYGTEPLPGDKTWGKRIDQLKSELADLEFE